VAVAAPAAEAEETAVVGAAPPPHCAGAAGCLAGCILQEFHRDSQRVDLQWNHSLVQVSVSVSLA
jgi:hypothetical protein